ncbi:MAG: response regulator transcription factor, partial [Dehalococcoidia bacterium]
AHQLLDIPVVVVDEHATAAEVVEWFAQGADDVITLPPDTSEVAARVASILRRSRRGPDRLPPVLLFDAVEVDTVRRVVRRPNEGAPDVPTELPLSPTEFSLLVTLIRAGGRVCTYRELAASGWESDSSASPHYLRLYMRFLRRKIEADPSQPRWLLNVRGVGYRLAPGVAGGTRRLTG